MWLPDYFVLLQPAEVVTTWMQAAGEWHGYLTHALEKFDLTFKAYYQSWLQKSDYVDQKSHHVGLMVGLAWRLNEK